MSARHGDAMRQALEQLDIPRLRRLWAEASPHLPQPATDDEVLVTAHMARAAARSIPFKLRAYSHAWLTERGYPSGLPDRLRPKAERIYPRIVSAVGIAVHSNIPEVAQAVRGAMADVVENVAADGRLEDTEYLRPRMLEARRLARRRLFGTSAT